MKLALNIGTTQVSAAKSSRSSATLMPLKSGRLFQENVLLWNADEVVAIGNDARDIAPTVAAPDARVIRDYKNDFTATRLRHLAADPKNPGQVREVCPEDYRGPFYRHGLVRAMGGMLRHFWESLIAGNPDFKAGALDGVMVGVPCDFHEFSRRRYLHAMRIGLADKLFPDAEFYKFALQTVSFVPEPLAALAAAQQIYGGRAARLLSGTDEGSILVIDAGGGTCECAVIKCRAVQGVLRPVEILAAMAVKTGGLSVDQKILDGVRALDPDLNVYIANRLHEPAFALQLFDSVRVVKEQLSDPEVGQTKLLIPEGSAISVARSQFTEWTAEMVEAIADMAEECLGTAGLTSADAHGALLIGGGAVIPELQLTLNKRLREIKNLAMPEPHEIDDATGAVTLGLARYEAYAEPVGMSPNNRRIESFNTGWTPHEQVPPPAEGFVTLFNPLNPDANKHPAKDFWWGFLQVPPGFRKLTVSLFAQMGRREHLFTLYGIPVSDADDMIVPERFQVYIDPRGDRVYPRIWVWDVRVKKFLVKVFDLAHQDETRLRDFVENERPAFSYTEGDIFDGHPIGKDLGWLPPVKFLARGDQVRVLTGDRADPEWFNTRDSHTTADLETPVQRVTGIYPRTAPMFVGPGKPAVNDWRLSEFQIRLDAEEPRNLQGLFVEFVGDGMTANGPFIARANAAAGASATPSAAENTSSTATPTNQTTSTSNSTSGRMSRAPKLAPDVADVPAPLDAPGTPDAFDPFAEAVVPPDASNPMGFSDLPPDALSQGAAGLPADEGAEVVDFERPEWGGEVAVGMAPTPAMMGANAGIAGAGAGVKDTAALPSPEGWPDGPPMGPPPEAWADSSFGSSDTVTNPALALTDSHSLPSSELRMLAGLPPGAIDTPTIRELIDLGIPKSPRDAAFVLERLYSGVLHGHLPPAMAEALVAILRARVELVPPPDEFGTP